MDQGERDQGEVVRYLLDVLDDLGLRYAVVGAYASSYWGEPRYTRDIDVVVDLPASAVGAFCSRFSDDDWYVSEVAAQEAVASKGQFNVVHTASGHKIDVMIARGDAWSREELQHRQKVPLLEDRDGYVARPEDVIIGKLWYFHEGGSDKHLTDIAKMLEISGEVIDRDSIRRWAEALGIDAEWEAVLRRLEQRG